MKSHRPRISGASAENLAVKAVIGNQQRNFSGAEPGKQIHLLRRLVFVVQVGPLRKRLHALVRIQRGSQSCPGKLAAVLIQQHIEQVRVILIRDVGQADIQVIFLENRDNGMEFVPGARIDSPSPASTSTR